MSAKNNAAASEPEFVLTRVFQAPRALVYKAWTDPAHMARWWGPHGMTTPVCEMDVRPGGAYRITMHAPDGVDYPIKGVFQKIVEPELIVMTQDVSQHPREWHDLVNPNRARTDTNPAGVLLTTVTFEDLGGSTKLTIRTVFKSAAVRDAMLKMGMTQGWSQSLQRLEALLAGESSDSADREIVTVRTFDAPRELVWKAWTDPRHIAQWWGPNGFTTTIHEMNANPGGDWKFIMHGPDGTDYKNENVYVEVERPKRLVYDHVSSPRHHVTVTFDEQGGKTTLTMRMVFESAELREKVVKKFDAVEGAKQTLARLGDYLPKISGESESTELLITRTFNAPASLVFDAWTKPQHLKQWQGGPKGFTVTPHAIDFRPGGAYRLCMRSPEGVDHWLSGVYREITPPRRLIFTHIWLNPDGKPGNETLVTLTFKDLGPKTELTLHQAGFKSVESRDGHQGGWTSTLDRFAEYLATI